MAITFNVEKVAFPKIKKQITKNWIKAVAQSYNKKIGNLDYLFCSDEKILEVNNQYLSHDYYTDIITFDYTDGDVLSSDIFISIDTVMTNSQKYQTEFIDELYRVIIHGVLHLCGINDKSNEEARIMRSAENKALQILQQMSEQKP